MDDTTISSADAVYGKRINFWGRLTVSLGLVLSLAAPIYLFTVEGLWPGWQPILTAFLAVAVIFGANWVVEPATYFPMLGVSGTYQAWLVGNISNKLLPASVTAQAATDTKPGGKRAELIAVAAISGAVIVHVFSMIVVVALLGNWIISILPDGVRDTFDYILPAVIGAVFVQLAFMVKDAISTVVSLVLGILCVFVLVSQVPGMAAFVLPIVVIGTIASSMFVGSRKKTNTVNEENVDSGVSTSAHM